MGATPAASLPEPEPWQPGAPKWTAVNATEWRKFLSTDTGRILMLRARAQECALAITSQQSNAMGQPCVYTFSDAINWLDSLSQVTGDQVTTTEAPTEAEPEALETPSA